MGWLTWVQGVIVCEVWFEKRGEGEGEVRVVLALFNIFSDSCFLTGLVFFSAYFVVGVAWEEK